MTGPMAPSAKDRKPAAPTMFAAMPGSAGSNTNPISVDGSAATSMYTQSGVYSGYVDPKKASSDLKALIEGSLDDDEDKPPPSVEEQEVPEIQGLKVKLLPHQVEGVEWMKGRELGPVKKGRVPKGGILADDMGLGKTLQSISLILSNAKSKNSTKFAGVDKATLVVAPLALIRQWEAELNEKIEPSHKLKVLVHHGPQRTKVFEELRRYDVVITTYQILVSEHNHTTPSVKAGCFGLHWYRVILDEAHTIKNRNAKATKACCDLRSVYRWCLSGTPMQNNLDELQSLIHFLRIKPYDDLREWKEHIDLPLKNGKGDVAIQRLHSLLRCFMKRRTKEILKKPGALVAVGAKTEGEEPSATSSFKVTERKVVKLQTVFSPAERRFYDRLQARTDKSLEAMMKQKGRVNYANALVLLLRLRQVCNHPKLVEGKLEKDKDALSTDVGKGNKKGQTDVDDLANLLGGMSVEAKFCDICGWELNAENRMPGKEMCKTCSEDLDYFNYHEGDDSVLSAAAKKTKKTKKSSSKKDKKGVHPKGKVKVKEVIEEKVKMEKKDKHVRKPRNRRAIVDSDDEEEGEWLVSGDEKAPLHLGQAGGTDDENAENGGDTIHTEGSEDDEDEDAGSKVDDFVVEDEDMDPEELRAAEEHYAKVDRDSDDSLESISVIERKRGGKKARAVARRVVESDSDDEEDEKYEEDEKKKVKKVKDESDGDDKEIESESSIDGISASELDSSDSSIATHPFNRRSTPIKKQYTEKTPLVLASAKIRQLLPLLHNEAHDHKFIVFSQFTSMLDIVERFLIKDGLRFVRYDGSMRNDMREAALDSLRHDQRTRVLLCSLRCGALGLNLTAASRVVILEPFWNPFVEEQAIDRVHRLTQRRDVVVYKLTVEDTVEERILELQEKKRELAEQAIEGSMKKETMKLGLKEMMELFKPAGQVLDGAGVQQGHEGELPKHRDREHRDREHLAGLKDVAGTRKAESEIYGRRWT